MLALTTGPDDVTVAAAGNTEDASKYLNIDPTPFWCVLVASIAMNVSPSVRLAEVSNLIP